MLDFKIAETRGTFSHTSENIILFKMLRKLAILAEHFVQKDQKCSNWVLCTFLFSCLS